MNFSDFLKENTLDDRENEKFSMSAKINGKTVSVKKENGRYVYYSEISKRWVPVSKMQVTFNDRTKEPGENNQSSNNTKSDKLQGTKSTIYNANNS